MLSDRNHLQPEQVVLREASRSEDAVAGPDPEGVEGEDVQAPAIPYALLEVRQDVLAGVAVFYTAGFTLYIVTII
jgi:hypothetical protein